MHSPVGMPGRAIRNPFLTEREQEREKTLTLLPVPQKMRQSLHSLLYYHKPWPSAADGDTDNALLSAEKTHGVSIT